MTSTHRKSGEQAAASSRAAEGIPQFLEPDRLPAAQEDFRARVAERAYYKAEQRGFEPGHEAQDWLEAEQELLGDFPAAFEPE